MHLRGKRRSDQPCGGWPHRIPTVRGGAPQIDRTLFPLQFIGIIDFERFIDVEPRQNERTREQALSPRRDLVERASKQPLVHGSEGTKMILLPFARKSRDHPRENDSCNRCNESERKRRPRSPMANTWSGKDP